MYILISLTHSSIDRHLACFHVLALVNNACCEHLRANISSRHCFQFWGVNIWKGIAILYLILHHLTLWGTAILFQFYEHGMCFHLLCLDLQSSLFVQLSALGYSALWTLTALSSPDSQFCFINSGEFLGSPWVPSSCNMGQKTSRQ